MSGRPRIARPSPALIVALMALVFAMAGSAVAAVDLLSKREKKQVRTIAGKVADKRITKRAPGLSVASAQSAATADFAKSAGSTTNELWAIVNADATLHRATPGITGVTQAAEAGKYLVSTDRDITQCYFGATIGGNKPEQGLKGALSVNAFGTNSVYVLSTDELGAIAPRPFTLQIHC